MVEADLYDPLRNLLFEKFKRKGKTVLEDTHSGKFSNLIKQEIPANREIIFHFLRTERPDLTGWVKEILTASFITVEIKDEIISLNDISQAKKYANLFKARYGFLITSKPIPVEIKRLHVSTQILQMASNRLYLAECSEDGLDIFDWYPTSPFS